MQLLTVTQVSAQTGLSEWAVRRAIHEGELQASKLRGRLRIDAVDLEAWVQESRVTPIGRAVTALPRAVNPAPVVVGGGSFRARMRKESA